MNEGLIIHALNLSVRFLLVGRPNPSVEALAIDDHKNL